jgi:hypothetical protein
MHILEESATSIFKDMHIWVPSFWTLRILRIYTWESSGTSVKEQGTPKFASDYGAQRARFKA